MSAIISTAMVGAVCALIIILVFMLVGRIYDLYVGIFTANGRARWNSWGPVKKVLWILGLPLLLIVVPMMIGFYVLFIISVLYLGLSIARQVFRVISN